MVLHILTVKVERVLQHDDEFAPEPLHDLILTVADGLVTADLESELELLSVESVIVSLQRHWRCQTS